MAPEIQLGYRIDDIELHSTAESSQAASENTNPSQRRTGEWILTLPSDPILNSNNDPACSSTKPGKNESGRLNGWQSLPPAVIQGPAAELSSHHDRWTASRQTATKNNLLFAVGLLELANACDFAANVFNQVPIPRYAAVLMGLGGCVALLMLFFAVKDARLSWINLRLIRLERHRLLAQLQQSQSVNGPYDNQTASIEACLAVNLREIGFELVDRFMLDVIMGGGCLLVGIGTLMAIGGQNPHVFMASNLLSGYIGNAPAALYGLVNAFWCLFIWFRADKHSRICRSDVAVALVWPRLSHRHDTVKLHALIYGLTGLVAGAGSVMTATLWEGYVMLIPCVIASGWCNWLWRNKVGYGRPILEIAPPLSRDSLIAELQAIALIQRNIKQTEEAPQFDDNLLCLFLEIVRRYDLMIPFCLALHQFESAGNENRLFRKNSCGPVTIRAEDILSLGPTQKKQVFGILQDFVLHKSQRSLVERERFLLELLGSYFFVIDNSGFTSGTSQDFV